MHSPQTSSTPTSRVAAREERRAADLDLDALAGRSYDALAELYRTARRPASMRDADGPLRGRMLAVRAIDALPAGRLLRAFAGSRAFLWDGKTFSARSDDEGAGINRIKIAGALGRQSLFPFATRFGSSELDGGPTLILDYDLPENPPWIRRIHDEIREVAPGLFLGPAMWKGARSATTLLWFALDAREAS
jgi:hypothetical protein